MNCQDVEQRDFVEAYAHGRLTAAEMEAFEEHFFACAKCFDDLQNYRALHGALVGQKTASLKTASRPAWSSVSMWGGLAAAATLALAIAATWQSGREAAPPTGAPQATAPPAPVTPVPPAPVPAGPTRAELVQQLARYDPPSYDPPVLRGAEDEARRRFAAAMAHYQRGDFAAAATALRSETRTSVNTAELQFYLAVAELQTGQTAEAIADFERVIATGDMLFEEDAHFFLAKAWLRQGEVTRARAAADKVVTLNGDRERDARLLVTAIDRLPSR